MAKFAQGEALAEEAGILRRLGHQLQALEGMVLAELREQYKALFGEEARSKNLPFLRKKLAFRLQEQVEGGLSPAALARIEELAPATLPVATPKERTGEAARSAPRPPQSRDNRLPEAGTVLKRDYKGFTYEVEVKEDQFLYRGRTYTSLSSIAKEITGTPWNGFTFFGLKKEQVHGEA
ncbi:DUF2924 domain-containing protein [Geothrix mesophila]|uniref:DUF2924 domain-containing protein n=1 Tax=Geothrix mesophila TaxID=2922723 RepID=UPI001FACA67A|nr:DUF2924 domain-containing protein [Geothrix sp. SG198]